MIPDKVHLVGSIGLDTVEEVYRTVGKLARTAYPSRVRGGPGGWRLWISWQYPLLRASPFLKIDSEADRVKEHMRCPNTGQTVQGWFADEVTDDEMLMNRPLARRQRSDTPTDFAR